MENSLLDFIEAYHAFALFLLMLLENIFPPIPSELILPLSGYLIAEGKLSVLSVFLSSTEGALLGVYLWYLMARKLGKEKIRSWIAHYGFWLTIDENQYDRALEYFEKYRKRAVFGGRMIPTVRTLISIPAGLACMSHVSFLALSFAGTALWNGLLIGAGYFLGSSFEIAREWAGTFSNIVLILLAAIYLYRLARQFLNKGKN